MSPLGRFIFDNNMKRLKIILLIAIIILGLFLWWNYADEGTVPTPQAEEQIEITTGNKHTANPQEDYQRFLEEEMALQNKVYALVGDSNISATIVSACSEITDDKVLCIKNLLWVSNAESWMFKAWMTPTNNGFWFMQKGKKKKFSSVEESIIFRVERYQKKGRRKRTTWADWLKGKYCTSACTHRIGNYDAAIRKLGL